MDNCTTLVKYVLFIFNIIVATLGTLAVFYGVLMINSMGAVMADSHNGIPPQLLPVLLIVFGVVVAFISFLGCCGAIRENVCLTMCYAVVIFVLLLLQLCLVVFLWINKTELKIAMGDIVDKAWQRDESSSGVFEAIQQSFKCCGSNGPTDYALRLQLPPPSCCPSGSMCTPVNYYDGCKGNLIEFISGSTDNAKFFGLGLIAVELAGFIFACCLANNVRNYKRRNAY